MQPQRSLGFLEPGTIFTVLGFCHTALLISLAHGFTTTSSTTVGLTTTKTITVAALPSAPPQTLQFQNPANLETGIIFECPAKCNGGAACEFVNPTNCNEYISCDDTRAPVVYACEEGLHFWQQMRQCAPPSQAKCIVNWSVAGRADL